jgi:hypothetical protein
MTERVSAIDGDGKLTALTRSWACFGTKTGTTSPFGITRQAR